MNEVAEQERKRIIDCILKDIGQMQITMRRFIRICNSFAGDYPAQICASRMNGIFIFIFFMKT